MSFATGLSRREALKLALAAGASAGVLGRLSSAHAAGTINFADIGVGDTDGDWSRYTKASGYNVNLVAIGNAPSEILNVLVASGGAGTYDVINIVGGMQKPLVDNDLIEELDTFMLDYRINMAVVDSMPDTRKSYEFAQRFWGFVKMCYYSMGVQGKVLVEMIVNTHLEWERERKLLIDMVTRYLESPSELA